MQLGEIGGLAAFSDQDQIGIAFELGNGFDQVAMAQLGGNRFNTLFAQPGLGFFKQEATALEFELVFLLVEIRQLLEQC